MDLEKYRNDINKDIIVTTVFNEVYPGVLLGISSAEEVEEDTGIHSEMLFMLMDDGETELGLLATELKDVCVL